MKYLIWLPLFCCLYGYAEITVSESVDTDVLDKFQRQMADMSKKCVREQVDKLVIVTPRVKVVLVWQTW